MRIARLSVLIGLTLMSCQSAFAGLLGLPRDDNGILPVDQAFVLHPPVSDQGKVLLSWDIAPGCYLYGDRLSVSVLRPEGVQIQDRSMPEGETYVDPHFGASRIFRQHLQVRFTTESGEIPQEIEVEYQGCAEDKVCYPPQKRQLKVMR